MQRNHHLARGIADQGWHRFTDLLRYRLKWRGEELIRMGRFEPSSGLCPKCGSVKRDLKLSERAYHCDARGFTIDRDLNASLDKHNETGPHEGRERHPRIYVTPVEMPQVGCLNHDDISYV